jgi:hypothetical protein
MNSNLAHLDGFIDLIVEQLMHEIQVPFHRPFTRRTAKLRVSTFIHQTEDKQMPKVSEMIVSKFLKKEDIEDDVVVTCKRVALEDMPGDAGERRWVLYFKELSKGLVLNTTSIRVAEKTFGPDSDDWIGQKVTLYVDPNVQFKGQIVGGLRIRPIKTKPPKAVLAAQAEKFDDEIP